MRERDDERQPQRQRRATPVPAAAHRVLVLQRAVGNHAVGAMLARQPNLDPRTVADRNPHWGAGRPAKPRRVELSMRKDALSYDKQPAALREVLERSWGEAAFSRFSALSQADRSNLIDTYNRMMQYGFWWHVKRIVKLEPREPGYKLGPLELRFGGVSASVVFEIYDRTAFFDAMKTSPAFGKDDKVENFMHRDKEAFREFATKTRDGIHISLGGSTADAHLDVVSPTDKPVQGETKMNLTRGIAHWMQELFPEFIRKGLNWPAKLPRRVYEWLADQMRALGARGTAAEFLLRAPARFLRAIEVAADIVFSAGIGPKPSKPMPQHPDAPSQRDREPTPFVVIKEIEWGGESQKARKPKDAPRGEASLAEPWAAAVKRGVPGGTLMPAGRREHRDSHANNEDVAIALAGRMVQAGREGRTHVEIDLGYMYASGLGVGGVASVKAQLAVIGKAARNALLKAIRADGQDGLAERVGYVRSGRVYLDGKQELVSFV